MLFVKNHGLLYNSSAMCFSLSLSCHQNLSHWLRFVYYCFNRFRHPRFQAGELCILRRRVLTDTMKTTCKQHAVETVLKPQTNRERKVLNNKRSTPVRLTAWVTHTHTYSATPSRTLHVQAWRTHTHTHKRITFINTQKHTDTRRETHTNI